MPGPQSKYVWPANALTADDMHALYVARSCSPVRTTIARLLAQAVRQPYGRSAVTHHPTEGKAA